MHPIIKTICWCSKELNCPPVYVNVVAPHSRLVWSGRTIWCWGRKAHQINTHMDVMCVGLSLSVSLAYVVSLSLSSFCVVYIQRRVHIPLSRRRVVALPSVRCIRPETQSSYTLNDFPTKYFPKCLCMRDTLLLLAANKKLSYDWAAGRVHWDEL